jgi:Chaperone of endosialidase/Secretion system C-terminal sorting domain
MKTKIIFTAFFTILILCQVNAQLKVVTTGNLAIGDITDPSLYKIYASNGGVALVGLGQTGYGSRLFKLYGNSSFVSFSANAYNLAANYLITRLGINYEVNGANSTSDAVTLGSKYGPYIELSAENGSISLWGENGTPGANYRLPSKNIGVMVQNNGYVGISNQYPSCALDIIGSVKVSSTSNLIGYVNINNPPSPTCPLEVSGTGKADAWTTRSDVRLKEDIINLKVPIDSLFLLQAVSYNLKWPVIPKVISFTSLGESKIDSLKTIQASNGNVNPAFRIDSALYLRRHIGFIAQDLQKIFPDLVYGNKDGILSIDYISIIPMLVDGLKQQQQIITAQSSKINDLDRRLSKIENGNTQDLNVKSAKSTDLATSVLSIAASNAFLYQNIPNPFSVQTEIKYYIPESATNASILIFNMLGTLIKSMTISAFGTNSQTISGSELKAGMYMYTLIVDSKEVDTKRMILTE